MWLPSIPHFLNRLLTEASQSQIETCSKVFSIKPALKATELAKVMASCTWSSRASELITDNFFTVNYLKTSYHLFCSVLTVFLSIFIDNDFKVPKVNYDESIACKELISSHYRNAPIEKRRPWKLGYPLGFASKNEVSKTTVVFGLLWTS